MKLLPGHDTSTHTKAVAGAQTTAARQSAPIRARVLVFILLLVPVMVFLMVWGTWTAGDRGGCWSLSGPGLSIITLVSAVNVVLKRRRPAWALLPGEIISIYVAVAVSTGITANTWAWGGNLAPTIAYPTWAASPANQWEDILLPNLPPSLIVTDRNALEGFFGGYASPYRLDVLRAWAQPAFWWTMWVSAVLWVMLCFGVIVRRRWSDEEKLPFPITVVPLHVAEAEGRLFNQPLWWFGLCASAALGVLQILHLFFPDVPVVPTQFDLLPFLSHNPPWDGLRTGILKCGLWEIGLSYLMPVDLAFSLVVFNVLWRVEYVAARFAGLTTNPWYGFPYGDQQVLGSFIGITLVVFWLDRGYLLQVLRKGLGIRSSADDRGEAFSYRAATFGAIAGMAFAWWFLVRGGMSVSVAGAFVILLLVMLSAMLRIRAHIGPPSHWMYGAMPEFVLTQFPGVRAIGSRGMGMIALLRPFMLDQGANPAPIQLEALRMAERGMINPRPLALLMVAVIPLTMLSYFWASLRVGYDYGLLARANQAVVWVTRWPSQELDAWLRTPTGPNWAGVEAIGVGLAATTGLMYLKLQFPIWSLHPVAFPLAFSWTIDSIIPAVAGTLLLKVVLIRYGGLRAHRRALPFFLGLLAGDASISLVETLTRCLMRAG